MGRRNELTEYTLREALSFPSDLADLRDEMTEWQGNMEGAGMEHLPKYEEVTECVDALERKRLPRSQRLHNAISPLLVAIEHVQGLYARWCLLAKRTLGWQLSAWDGSLWAAFTDQYGGDLVSADIVSAVIFKHTSSLLFRETYLADLAVRSDQLQAAGDPRGEWLAIWLMPPSEHRDRAVIDSTPALAQHVERLIAEHERRARRTKTLPKECPWSIEPNSTLVLRVDGGPDQVVTFRELDFADTRQVFPLELAVTINEQLTGAHAEHVDYTVEITSDTYDGKVEIIGGTAALALGLPRLATRTISFGTRWREDDLIDLLRDTTRPRHGMSMYGDDIRSPSVHDEVAVKPVDEAALAQMREAFAAFTTRRAPVSVEVLQAITGPSESRRP